MIVDRVKGADGAGTDGIDPVMAAAGATEDERLLALDAFRILHTFPEETYDRIVRRVSQFFAVPICLISFVGRDAQWFKAKIGLDIESAPRESSFSQAALESGDVFVVEDACASPQFAGHPAVIGMPGIRFYAGMALEVEQGQRIGILCVADIRPRRFDAAAREALKDFAALVVDALHLRLRTHRLEAELTAQREAKEAELRAQRERADFLAMVTHEVRTPLNAIVGIASLMCEQGAPQPEALGAAALLESSEHLMRLLNEVLDLVRNEATGFTFRREPFDLRRECRCALDVVRPQTAAKGVELILCVDPSVPARIVGDRTRVAQVLLNLLTNAAKFTGHGSIALQARAEMTGAAYGVLTVEVVDTGIGMDRASVQRLFAHFAQASPEIRSRYGGTGLGLAICQRLIAGMGGAIEADSTPAGGSRIRFTMPFEVPDAPAPAHPSDALAGHAIARGEHRVLVADDDAVSRRVMLAMLARLGYRVETFGNARDALGALRAEPFDVAIVDIHMPDMDGFSLATELRTQTQFGLPVPVIAVTGLAQADGDARADRLFDAYLEKPASAAVLDRTILAILSRRDGIAPLENVELRP